MRRSLYIAGNQAMDCRPSSYGKLRQFIEQGGLILATPTAPSTNFRHRLSRAGQAALPGVRVRPAAGESRHLHQRAVPALQVEAQAGGPVIGNGVRQLMILLPDADPAKRGRLRPSMGGRSCSSSRRHLFCTQSTSRTSAAGRELSRQADPKIQPTKTIKLARFSTPATGTRSRAGGGAWRRS